MGQAHSRAAAIEYVKQAKPGWVVQGDASFKYDSGTFVLGVDVSRPAESDAAKLRAKEPDRQTVDVLVRLFTAENGTPYWKAELLSAEMAQGLCVSVVKKGFANAPKGELP